MTMAPGRKKRGYWLEILFISVLLFLLWGSLTQRTTSTARNDYNTHPLQRGLTMQPLSLK
jgi:hypothetical protein